MTECPDGSDLLAAATGARRHVVPLVAGAKQRFGLTGAVGATFCAPSAEQEISPHGAREQQQAHQPRSAHRPFAHQNPGASTSPMGQAADLLLPCRSPHESHLSDRVTAFASQFKSNAAVNDRAGRASWSWLASETSSPSATAEATSSDGSE